MGADLIAGVEEILQRKVLAFLSANHIDPDIAVETFILASRTRRRVPEPPRDGRRPSPDAARDATHA